VTIGTPALVVEWTFGTVWRPSADTLCC